MNKKETKEYRFDEKRHRHELLVDGEWKSLTGTTTVLGVLAKPFLIQWSANMAVEYIENEFKKISSEVNVVQSLADNLPRILQEAKTAHRKKKEAAGDVGKIAHKWIEDWIKDNSLPLPEDEMVRKMVENFVNWAKENKVKFLESEKGLYSKTLFIGGIVDIVCEIDGEVYVADVKTGSGIYPEAFAQMASYELMLKEMGFKNPIKGHIVLNLKKDGTFEEKRSVSTEDAKKFFLACVEVYRLQEKFNNQII